jgi:histidine ammonia-lyase
VDAWLEEGVPAVYGVNTGLGNLKDVAVPAEMHRQWQASLAGPHAVGLGDPLPPEVVRAALLIRTNVLCRGHSGVRPELLQRRLDIFNAGIVPVVLDLGSTGLSDLGPLAQITLVVAGLEGAQVLSDGKRVPAAPEMERAGLAPAFELECKEFLAQMNGSSVTPAMAVLAAYRLGELTERLASETTLTQEDRDALLETARYITQVVARENNVSCDNPLLFSLPEGGYEAVMGCNCSNTQAGYVMDLLAMAAAKMGDSLPDAGDGATAMARARLRSLAVPASSDSIPTKANQEDHVEFSYGAAKKALKAVEILSEIL